MRSSSPRARTRSPCLLDADSGQVIDAIPMGEAPSPVRGYADGRTLAVANDQKTIQLVDVRTHSTLRILPADEMVSDMQFSSDGQHMAAVDTAGTVYLWDDGHGEPTVGRHADECGRRRSRMRAIPRGSRSRPTANDWRPGVPVAPCACGRRARRKWPGELTGHTDMIRTLAWSPSGQTILTAAGQADDGMRVWDAATGQLAATIESFRCLPRRVTPAPGHPTAKY